MAEIAEKPHTRRFHYTLKALLALLTVAALLFGMTARFGVKGMFGILYCVWIVSPLWVPFCWIYFEAQSPRETS